MMDSSVSGSNRQEAYVVLSELLGLFWRGKRVILIMTALSVLMGGFYLWSTPPLYEAKAFIVSPTEGDVACFNAGRSITEQNVLHPFTVKSIYRVFVQAFASQSAKQMFFDASGMASYRLFDQRFFVREEPDFSPGKHPAKYSVTARAPTAALARDEVTRYVDWARKNAMDSLLSIMSAQKKGVAAGLIRKIEVIQAVSEQNRLDRLTQLNEALHIARSIGRDTESSDSSSLYMRGTKALLAEINALNARESNDPFSPGLRELQREYASLQKAQINPEEVNMFHLDGAITTSNAPVSPKKQLILILALVLGLSLGCLMVLVRALFLIKNPSEASQRSPGLMRRIFQ
jgi:chain length determinant protein (polysaccharide antigen chain regulator)